MSYTPLIKDNLNIYFEKNCFTNEKYKGQICWIYKGTLQYTPEECPHYLFVVPRPLNPFKQTLPKGLCLAEFKSVRSIPSTMSFIMMDGQKDELLDIVENQR